MQPLDVLCPHCSAYVKNPCLTSEGVPMKGFHAERKQAARRMTKLEPRSDPDRGREAGKEETGSEKHRVIGSSGDRAIGSNTQCRRP